PRADGGAQVAGVLRRRARLARQQHEAPRASAGVRPHSRADRSTPRSDRPVHRQPHAARDRGIDPGRDHRREKRRVGSADRVGGGGEGEARTFGGLRHVLTRSRAPMEKKFASQADLEEKKVSFDKLSDHAYAYTAEGDPNTGIVVGDDAVMVIDTQATPVMAQDVIKRIRGVTDKPIRYVTLSHYHAVRVLGASAY